MTAITSQNNHNTRVNAIMFFVHTLIVGLLLCPCALYAIHGVLRTCRPWCRLSSFFQEEERSEETKSYRKSTYDKSLYAHLRAKYDLLSSLDEAGRPSLLLPHVEENPLPTCDLLEPPKLGDSDIYSYFFNKHGSDLALLIHGEDFETHQYPQLRALSQQELDAYGLLEVLLFIISFFSVLSVTCLYHLQILHRMLYLKVSSKIEIETCSETSSDFCSEAMLSIDIPSPLPQVKEPRAAIVNDENQPNLGTLLNMYSVDYVSIRSEPACPKKV